MSENPVYSVGLGKRALFGLAHLYRSKVLGYVLISFVGDCRFQILARGRLFKRFLRALPFKLQLVALQKLYRVEQRGRNLFRFIVRASRFYFSFERARKHAFTLSFGGHGASSVHKLLYALLSHRGNLNDGHSKLFFQSFGVDFVARLFHLVHHVEGDDYGNVHFQKLGCKIQIPL